MKNSVYIVKRLFYTVLVLFAVSILVFLITQAFPGTAPQRILGQFASPEAVQALERELGLDRPVYIQYFDWISGIFSGDWGRSIVTRENVVDRVLPRFYRSAILALMAFLMIAIFGILLGTIAAVKRNTWIDSVTGGFTYIGVSFPEFVTGIFLIFIFAQGQWAILPQSGYTPISEGVIPWLSHLILPAISATLLGLSHVMRQTRSGMIDALQSEYVRTARLKGMKESVVIRKHALRNGLLESVTVLALGMGWLLGSLVVIEEVFAYPGLGRLIMQAISSQDIPVLQASILIIAATYALSNLCADLLYSTLDPRIKYD